MKLTIAPTDTFATIEGRPVRLWTGFDSNGTAVHVYAALVQPQTHDEDLLAEYDTELAAVQDVELVSTEEDLPNGPPTRCEACEAGYCYDCGLQSWCNCECEGREYEPDVVISVTEDRFQELIGGTS